jgi:murein DD-endopeptidase MepM/ murein hydrolase activator NlpD
MKLAIIRTILQNRKGVFFALSIVLSSFVLLSNVWSSSVPSRPYTVRPKDTLYDISRRYGISLKEILEINGLSLREKIYPGQKLLIPYKNGVWHPVKKYETLWRIARTYGVSLEEIKEANHLSSSEIKAGQKLFIPEATEVKSIEIPDYLSSEKKVLSRPESIDAPPIDTSEEKLFFLWPVEGEVIGYFGDKENKGIDIAAPQGTTIVAPADGLVDLTGEYKDLGRYLVIKHKKEGLITVYLHLSSWLVKKGDRVKKGNPIAKVGITGTVEFPCLHFEVYKAGTEEPEPVNPLDYLP